MRDKKTNKLSDNSRLVDRRHLLKGAGIIGAASLISACGGGEDSETKKVGAPAILSKKRSLKMVTTWPKNFPGLGTTAQDVSARIDRLSEGQIKVKVYAGGELVGKSVV